MSQNFSHPAGVLPVPSSFLSPVTRLGLALLVALVLVSGAFAKSPIPSLNLSNAGLALRGYDPVAYFEVGKPVRGKRDISVSNGGARYLFSSTANKEQFLLDPDKYLPEYGGYCAYGTAVNNKVDGDPKVWRIVGGKLYLNINRSVERTWRKDPKGYIRKANRNWPRLRDR